MRSSNSKASVSKSVVPAWNHW